MMYPVEIAGFESQEIEVQPAGIFSGAKLLVNGRPAQPGPKRGQMLLPKDDGTEAIAEWRPSMLGFDTPKLEVDGEVIQVTEPLKWYELMLSAFPILLVFMGGMLGALVGFIAFTVNIKVFQSGRSTVAKYLLVVLISILAAVIYFAIAVTISVLIGT